MPSKESAWVELCPLQDFSTAEGFLKDTLGASGQAIKAQGFDRTWLAAPLKARALCRVPLELVNRHEIWPEFEGSAPRILEEDRHFLALHKPAGVHTHPQGYEDTPNLLSWLVTQKRFDLLSVNAPQSDRGCLYRLDLPTSGLVLYAKSTDTYQAARKNFASLFHAKLYLCIVKGNPGEASEVVHQLAPYGPKGATMKVAKTGQRAVLSYRTLATKDDYSLVQVRLQTGLRHQIRVQLAALGFPLLGDTQYGGSEAERLYLHCHRYELNWEGQTRAWQDDEAELFDRFFDLHRLL